MSSLDEGQCGSLQILNYQPRLLGGEGIVTPSPYEGKQLCSLRYQLKGPQAMCTYFLFDKGD